MDSVKNRGRNKFSACFNPTIVDKDAPCSHSAPSHFAVGESRRRKKTAHRSISSFVKAVFFKTPLLKKLRSKRSKRDPFRSSSKIPSSKIKTQTKSKKTQSIKDFSDPDEVFLDNSDRSSIFSSSSRASSISSNSTSGLSERIKAPSDICLDSNMNSIRQHAIKLVSRTSKCDCRGFMFIILVCLLALVFWGKAVAVVTCTSAWLFLAPSQAGHRGGPHADDEVVGSEEYKKRVIMEGLLERNIIRSRVIH